MADTGKVIPIAVASEKSHALAPNFSDGAGLKNVTVEAVMGILAKAGSPDSAVEKLATDIQAAMESPEIQEQLRTFDMEPVKSTPCAIL